MTDNRIKLVLKNGFIYRGVILEDNKDSFVINDSFNKKVTIYKHSVSVIEVLD